MKISTASHRTNSSLTHRKTDQASRSTSCKTVETLQSANRSLHHPGGVVQIGGMATNRLRYSFLCACNRHKLRDDMPLSSTWRHIKDFARKHAVRERGKLGLGDGGRGTRDEVTSPRTYFLYLKTRASITYHKRANG